MGNSTGFTDENDTNIQTDEEILRSILPCNVWASTAKKLQERHPSSLENLNNSSSYFRNLLLSQRCLFLFSNVFKVIGSEFAKEKNTKTEGSSITNCRITCKQWNKAVDKFINDGTPEPDFFITEHPFPSDHALVNARYHYFGREEPTKLPRFLEHFQQTHLPHFSRNPFVGKVVCIDLFEFTDHTQWASIADQVSTLLRKYGRHINILTLGLFMYCSDNIIQQQKHLWLAEWLESCPNLTHLKVSEISNRGLLYSTTCSRMERDATSRTQHMQQQPMQIIPMPTLKSLQCLKLNGLSAINFNSLISSNTHVVWLHIEPLNRETEKQNYNNFLALEFPNLKKLYLNFGSPEDVRKLRRGTGIHQSWLLLTHIHLDCGMTYSNGFMEWFEIFELISQNWGHTLTNLKLGLPRARTDVEQESIVRDTENCRLALPILKRLMVWLNKYSENPPKTDFLDMLKTQLEQLIIIEQSCFLNEFLNQNRTDVWQF